MTHPAENDVIPPIGPLTREQIDRITLAASAPHADETGLPASPLHRLADEWIRGADLSPDTEAEVRWMAGELLTALASLPTEWGVRYPSGAVESYGSNEHKARRFALAATGLRPDLPTLVVRQVVTPWECVIPPASGD